MINGVNISFDRSGSGVPLLLIHGYPLNRTLWQHQLKGLGDLTNLIIPDLRGHGESDTGSQTGWENLGYPMELLADDCCALLDHLHIKQPVVVGGLSMGGYVAFAFYRKFTQRVAGLILAATRAGEDTTEGKTNRDKAAELARQSGPSAIAESMLPKMMSPKTYQTKPKLVDQVLRMMQTISIAGIVGDLMGMKTRLDSTPMLPQINIPVLILHGADDQLIPLQEAQAMHAALPNANLHIIPDAGHLIPLEQPDITNQAFRNYLTQFT
jgi:pimeloyl-ACP methyl ester carboxylesterase